MADYTDTDDDFNRARRIVELADRIGLDRDLEDVLFDVMDGGDGTSTPVHALIRESFTSDDDFDDLKHEIEHVIGDCRDGDNDCPWNPDGDWND